MNARAASSVCTLSGPCALCDDVGQLEERHLRPKFLKRRWMRDSNPGYARGAGPNRRRQDTKQISRLCRLCEDRFSNAETAFATAVYHPTRADVPVDIVWTERLMYFAASITWRNIMLALLEPPEHGDRGASDYAVIRNGERRLRAYLLGETSYPVELEHHLFIPGSGMTTGHAGLNVLFHTGFGHWMPVRDGAVYSVVLIPGMILVTLLKADAPTRSAWAASNTRTLVGANVRNRGHHMMDGFIGNLLASANSEHQQRLTELPAEDLEKRQRFG